MKNLMLVLFAAFAVLGCASSGTNFDSRKISDIHKGQTTETDLLNMFGKPNSQGVNSENGTTLTWFYSEARAKGESFIPFAGPFVGGVKSNTKMLLVNLDLNGKVASYNYSGGGFQAGGGMQPDPENTNVVQAAKSPRDQ